MARSLTLPFARALPAAAPASAAAAASLAATFTAAFTATVACSALAAAALRPASRLRSTAFGLGHQRLARESHFSTLVALDELHAHAIAFLDDILGLLGASVLHLGDVQQSLRARHDLDERAERRGGLHQTLVDLADNRLGRDGLNHLPCALHRLASDRGNRDDAVVVNGDLGTRFLLDSADRFALR